MLTKGRSWYCVAGFDLGRIKDGRVAKVGRIQSGKGQDIRLRFDH